MTTVKINCPKCFAYGLIGNPPVVCPQCNGLGLISVDDGQTIAAVNASSLAPIIQTTPSETNNTIEQLDIQP